MLCGRTKDCFHWIVFGTFIATTGLGAVTQRMATSWTPRKWRRHLHVSAASRLVRKMTCGHMLIKQVETFECFSFQHCHTSQPYVSGPLRSCCWNPAVSGLLPAVDGSKNCGTEFKLNAKSQIFEGTNSHCQAGFSDAGEFLDEYLERYEERFQQR